MPRPTPSPGPSRPDPSRPGSSPRPSTAADTPTLHDTPVDDHTNGSETSGTIAGMLLAARYRLSNRVGSDTAAGAEFWRAEDTILRRDVAITVLRRFPESESDDAADGEAEPIRASRAGEMMVRALRSGSFEHSGCARLLDVLAPGTGGMPPDVLGAAVTEWVPGRSLAEVVDEGLTKPTTVARGVVALASAAEAAHRRGLVLGIDHPQRVRVTPTGQVKVCFALPRPTVTPADDVRGLGAVLYVLLTSRWPLSGADAARAGLATADRTPTGEVVAPSQQRPGVPVELDTLTAGTLGPDDAPGHVHTAAAVHRLLDEVLAEDDRTALFPPEHDGVPSSPGDVWQDNGQQRPVPDPGRRRKLTIGVSVLAVLVLVVAVFVTMQFGQLFSDGDGSPAIVVDSDSGGQAAAGQDGGQPAPTGGPAAVAGVEVYAPKGDADNAGRVAQVIDGNTSSGWKTSTYKQQFPALKPGIGVVVSFASAVRLAEVTINSPTPGTVVEIRSAPAADSDLDETTVIGEATLEDGETKIALQDGEPVSHVIVWITQLSGGGTENSSQLNEVEFTRAG